MFRPLLVHHQESYTKNKLKYLNSVLLIWIHILQSDIIIIIIIANTPYGECKIIQVKS
jgi:hypothetical protein